MSVAEKRDRYYVHIVKFLVQHKYHRQDYPHANDLVSPVRELLGWFMGSETPLDGCTAQQLRVKYNEIVMQYLESSKIKLLCRISILESVCGRWHRLTLLSPKVAICCRLHQLPHAHGIRSILKAGATCHQMMILLRIYYLNHLLNSNIPHLWTWNALKYGNWPFPATPNTQNKNILASPPGLGTHRNLAKRLKICVQSTLRNSWGHSLAYSMTFVQNIAWKALLVHLVAKDVRTLPIKPGRRARIQHISYLQIFAQLPHHNKLLAALCGSMKVCLEGPFHNCFTIPYMPRAVYAWASMSRRSLSQLLCLPLHATCRQVKRRSNVQ